MNNISNSRNSDYEAKQEVANNDGSKIVVAKPNLTTSSWSRLKDPRIVRVSRAFGGKDRHSKVCTVRGLRDRRVRLSVPTAIQLYDLQDRLGLNQPSKVVDWLLDAAKNEIDELPPLQIPPGNFGQNLQAMLNTASSHEGAKTNPNGLNWEDYWNPDKSKVVPRAQISENCQENEEDDDTRNMKQEYNHSTFFQPSNSSNLQGLFPNNNSHLLKWDASNLSLSSQFGSYGDHHNVSNFNMNVAAAALPSIPSGSQVLLYPPPPPPPQTQSYFPSHNDEEGFDHSKFTQPPLYSINNQGAMRQFHLSMNPKFFSSEDINIGGPHDQQSNK